MGKHSRTENMQSTEGSSANVMAADFNGLSDITTNCVQRPFLASMPVNRKKHGIAQR